MSAELGARSVPVYAGGIELFPDIYCAVVKTGWLRNKKTTLYQFPLFCAVDPRGIIEKLHYGTNAKIMNRRPEGMRTIVERIRLAIATERYEKTNTPKVTAWDASSNFKFSNVLGKTRPVKKVGTSIQMDSDMQAVINEHEVNFV